MSESQDSQGLSSYYYMANREILVIGDDERVQVHTKVPLHEVDNLISEALHT